MSFILDALKKSEERRRLLEASGKPGQKILDLSRSGSRRWPTGLLLTLLLAALAVGWWLRGASLQPVVAPSTVVSGNLDSPPASPPPRLPPTARSQVASETPLAQLPARPAPFAPVPAEAFSAAVAPTATAPTARSQPAVSQIPAALRERLPNLSMSLHFYAEEPARRMVRIDNRIVREGQALAEQLVLEEITPTGAIFSFAGERFSVGGPGGQP